jgi:hypothetical protein
VLALKPGARAAAICLALVPCHLAGCTLSCHSTATLNALSALCRALGVALECHRAQCLRRPIKPITC